MAIKTYYFKNAVPTGATLHRSLQDGGTAPTTATTTTGWNAGTNAAGQSCLQNGGTEVSRNSTTPPWSATLQPSAAPSQTLGDCWRSENTLSGTFANTNWTLSFGVRSVTAAYTGRFRLAVRIWKSTNANGTGATELTAGRVTSAITAANLSTTADTTVSITWTPGATQKLSNEYLFVQVGIEITTAGGGTTQDIDFRVGSAYTLVTPDFVLTSSGAFAASEAAVKDTFTSTGDIPVQGSLDRTESESDTLASTGDVVVQGDLIVTEAGFDTFNASGTVKTITNGTMSPHESGNDSATASGKVIVKGSLSQSEIGSDLFDSQGSTASGSLVGDLHGTESGSDTLASTGKVIVNGTVSATEQSDSFTAAGKVFIAGLLASSETSSDAFDSQGTLTSAIVGDLHGFEEGTDTFAGDGTEAETGALVAYETGFDEFEASGTPLVQGSFSANESGDLAYVMKYWDGSMWKILYKDPVVYQ